MDASSPTSLAQRVLAPYRLVKDTRTAQETSNVDAVLDGDLDAFIEAYLLGSSNDKGASGMAGASALSGDEP